MDNQETLSTLGTQDTRLKPTEQKPTQKRKQMNNPDTTENRGMNPGVLEG
jgi:hypothetical protein